MARLFVANPTPQNARVMFRVDFDKSGRFIGGGLNGQRGPAPKHQDIPAGKQVCLGGDLEKDQITDIIAQLKTFGAVTPEEIRRGRGPRIAYLYQEGTPIKESAILDARKHNQGMLMSEGEVRRQNAAVAAHEAVNHQIEAALGESVPALTVEFEQEQVSEAGETPIAQGIKVDVTANDGGPKPRAPRRSPQRRAA